MDLITFDTAVILESVLVLICILTTAGCQSVRLRTHRLYPLQKWVCYWTRSDSDTLVLGIWEVWTTLSLPLLPGPLSWFRFGLISLFNGISTFVGYLMPKLFFLKNSCGTVGECVKEFICIFMVSDYFTLSLCILKIRVLVVRLLHKFNVEVLI